MNVSTAPLNLPLTTAHLPTESAKSAKLSLNKIPEPTFSQAIQANRAAPNQETLAEAPTSNNVNVGPNKQDKKVEQKKEQEQKEQRDEDKEEFEENKVVQELVKREREVILHEQAHASVGGKYAGAPTYEYTKGPDNKSYIVGGEVSIDTSEEATPQQTLSKAEIIRRAALAPAEPSNQDRRVAAEAAAMALKAKAEIAKQTSTNDQSQDKEVESKQASQEDQNTLSQRKGNRLSIKLNFSGALGNLNLGESFSATA